MGLTKDSVGRNAADTTPVIKKKAPGEKIIALAGNPNVGKSTVFNALTGMNQHTGNWPGKTVAIARGRCETKAGAYILVDLPGTYSLSARSVEETVAKDFICSGIPDAVCVVCDATCLERNLILVLQVLDTGVPVIVCVNLMDEARRKGISVNTCLLSLRLGTPVVGVSARAAGTLLPLTDAMDALTELPRPDCVTSDSRAYVRRAEALTRETVTCEREDYDRRDRRIDRILTSRLGGYPCMLLLLALVFWLTLQGANYPSALLSSLFFKLQDVLLVWANALGVPPFLRDSMILGVYRTLAWVVSVMLPPMAIFFPLFTLLEDVGFLPRVAYNLDSGFKKCSACGKQALTMCLGFGCNAAGVAGCRIIDSERERLIAIITNSFVPCNGRFPTIIAIITMFFAWGGGLGGTLFSALLLTLVILLGVLMTFVASRILSATILKGAPSSFTLELPPYRKPEIGKVIVRSIFDRTLFVLGRAVVVAAPAGLIIWLMANISVGTDSLLGVCADFLDPFARLIGLDGVILMAFILGFPANEIVVPIIIMAYLAEGGILELSNLTALRALLLTNGWSLQTAVSMLLFSLFHWPCSTTLITVYKETGSAKWTAAAFLAPTLTGLFVCFAFNLLCLLI
ncbi:MAG: ferrous iron transporter B [Oscillospiraceae bacterium]